MLYKDYIRLSKISIKSRKQSSRSTVRGISFGMILLIPVIFIVIGLYIGFNETLNKYPDLLYATVEFAHDRSGLEDRSSGKHYKECIITEAHAENLINKYNKSDVFYYDQIYAKFLKEKSCNQFFVPESEIFSVSLNGQAFLSVKEKEPRESPFAAILNNKFGSNYNFIPDKVNKVFNGNIYLDGYCQGFTGNGKKQIIVSEVFLNKIGVKPENAFKNTLSLKYKDFAKDNIYIDNDNNPNNNNQFFQSENYWKNEKEDILFFNNFEIVGIIKKEVTEYVQTMSGSAYQSKIGILSNMIFMTEASVIMDNEKYLEPEINAFKRDESNYFHIATYSYSEEEFKRLNSEYVCFGAGHFNSYCNNGFNSDKVYPYRTLFFEASSYNELNSFIKSLSEEISFVFNENALSSSVSYFSSSLFQDLYMIFTVMTYIVLFLCVMGGIIFFAAMVNLFNSIAHSVDTRKHYLGVMRAIGAKSSVIPKLYFAETITLFKRSAIWIIVFSAILCIGFKIMFDEVLRHVNEAGLLPAKLEVSYAYIPIAIVIGLVALVLLGFTFSYFLSRKVSKSTITNILGDN